ncbi:hypothetical protein KXX16_003585 [Aspergillus fumigatus]|nr:hypothetical protein KXX16_003585 [Aspergillus fumigatus]KAH1966846.1 hypothetical protein KXV80_003809 [Aspergillus fumigatus]KAH2388054.1 hypothetical protein KXW92_003603 [Aspergillus fumigatus]KAH3055413.1 hypothetical protein KXW16_007231 [Aspergillus fumigatus]KAH3145598.1 hypothetical protein KXW80_000510 [Aspergillus fumigatus]
MAGISKLPEELRLEILDWLIADQDALFSLYNTSLTFRSYVVSHLLKRAPSLLISWAAMNGDFNSLQEVVNQYPEATINGSGEKLSGLCPPHALVIAARKGHAKVVEVILTMETTHKAKEALIKAAKGGHTDVVSVMLENFLGHRSSGFHDALSEAIKRGHLEVKKVFREYGKSACHHCTKNLNLTARKGKRWEKGRNGKRAKREKGKISGQHRVAK